MIATQDERIACQHPKRLNVGTVRHYRDTGPFTIDIDATPLVVLAESANLGDRVYEFLSVRRPGDVLPYLRVRLVAVHPVIQNSTNETRNSWDKSTDDVAEIQFTRFDRLFVWGGDDTSPEATTWFRFLKSDAWIETVTAFFEHVVSWQKRLRAKNDFLLQHEIALIDGNEHLCDFHYEVERQYVTEMELAPETRLPPLLYELIASLIQHNTVQSVSCPFGDHNLWRMLVTEQIRRAERLKLPLQSAFGLFGPDYATGLGTRIENWGGKAHIPAEGVCAADLFIKPSWFQFNTESAERAGRLIMKPYFDACHYMLSEVDYGNISCATKKLVDDGWVLYESKPPYVPVNNFK